MIPSRRHIIVLLIIFTLSLLSIAYDWITYLIYIAMVLLAVQSLLDFLYLRRAPQLELQRLITPIIPVENWRHVEVDITNSGLSNYLLDVFDIVPEHIQFKQLPVTLSLAPKETKRFSYPISSFVRGDYQFNQIQIRLYSPSGLYSKLFKLPLSTSFKIYPDYMPVIEYALLASNKHTSLMGIHKTAIKGTGEDFLELRDYRQGDTLRQIDWRTSSRLNKLISKEYQAEQNQEIIFLVDSSHRMNITVDNLKHFDHALNALLLTSYLALKQGDTVSITFFGAGQCNMSSPIKGLKSFDSLLNTVYAMQAGNHAADYLAMAEALVKLRKKRATVILLTNIRDAGSEDLLAAVNYLKTYHRVLIASLRENLIDELTTLKLTSFNDALLKSAALLYETKRNAVIQQIRHHKITAIDVSPADLPVALANQFLAFKLH